MKKTIAIIITLSLALSAVCFTAAAEDDGFEFLFDAETGTITGYTGTIEPDLTIPAEINGVKVKEIGTKAFASSDTLERVTISEGIKVISYKAFQFCRRLKSVFIPSSVKTIRGYAFLNCENLNNINFPAGIESIQPYTFEGCAFETLDIPESVTHIGCCAFLNCNKLIVIRIPSKVTDLERMAFAFCDRLEAITLPESLKTIGEAAFMGCRSLSSIELPEGVTQIGASTFANCTSLSSIELPEGVTQIGASTFANCTSLSSIELPEGVTQIGASTFANCTRLTNISVPKSVETIEDYAFSNCYCLRNVYYAGDASSWDAIQPQYYKYESHNGILYFAEMHFGEAMKPAKSYKDVPENHKAAEAIRTVTEMGLFKGTTSEKFCPDNLLTEAMLAAVVARIDGADFSQLKGVRWTKGVMNWAVEKKIIADELPGKTVTKGEFAKALYNYLIGKMYSKPVSWVTQPEKILEIINGDDGSDHSADIMTRADAAVLLIDFYKIYCEIADGDIGVFSYLPIPLCY